VVRKTTPAEGGVRRGTSGTRGTRLRERIGRPQIQGGFCKRSEGPIGGASCSKGANGRNENNLKRTCNFNKVGGKGMFDQGGGVQSLFYATWGS